MIMAINYITLLYENKSSSACFKDIKRSFTLCVQEKELIQGK